MRVEPTLRVFFAVLLGLAAQVYPVTPMPKASQVSSGHPFSGNSATEAAAVDGLDLTLQTYPIFQQGFVHVLSASGSSTTAVTVDVYLVIKIPTGEFFSLLQTGEVVPGILPFLSSVALSAGFSFPLQPVFAIQLPALPIGTYSWFGGFTAPGTLDLLSNLAQADWEYGEPSVFTLFDNPGDSLLFRAETASEVIEYFGQKDVDGLTTSMSSARVQSSTGEITKVIFDDQSRLGKIVTFRS